ncbi:DNA polymerase III subunit [Candidatus Magnetomonas plexicatena]|uniref:DNA polymerase III subunit n=1 Tax=Candidatus Magnetomonas plexicatena TaxID=2552947 RepID=UPI001C78A0A8|nr:AAA family ATPase [Nitrospirales bacterium LBB_01]
MPTKLGDRMPLGIIGHERAVYMLTSMLKSAKVASSFLFYGPPGTGKTFTAFAFLKSMNCKVKGSEDFCGSCPSCVNVDKRVHPDLKVTAFNESIIKIEEIREIENFLATTPMQWAQKCLIMENADMMNEASANAFLKTLEEPPSGSVIVLITSKEEALPDTIRSRCLKIPFSPLNTADMLKVASNAGKHPDDIQLRLSQGDMGKAIDSEIVPKRNNDYAIFSKIFTGIQKPISKHETLKSRDDMLKWLHSAMVFLRDISILKIDVNSPYVVNTDMREQLVKLTAQVDIDSVLDSFKKLIELSNSFVLNLNVGVTFNYVCSVLGALSKQKQVYKELI